MDLHSRRCSLNSIPEEINPYEGIEDERREETNRKRKIISRRVFRGERPYIWLLGPPGTGKHTQGAKISKEFGYVHISVPDLVVEESLADTKRGEKVAMLLESKTKLPDDIALTLLKEAMTKRSETNPMPSAWLVSGYPRLLREAYRFEREIGRCGLIVYMWANSDHLSEGIFSKNTLCNSPTPPNLVHYLDKYHERITPLLQTYSNRLEFIDAHNTSEDIFLSIKSVIKRFENNLPKNNSRTYESQWLNFQERAELDEEFREKIPSFMPTPVVTINAEEDIPNWWTVESSTSRVNVDPKNSINVYVESEYPANDVRFPFVHNIKDAKSECTVPSNSTASPTPSQGDSKMLKCGTATTKPSRPCTALPQTNSSSVRGEKKSAKSSTSIKASGQGEGNEFPKQRHSPRKNSSKSDEQKHITFLLPNRPTKSSCSTSNKPHITMATKIANVMASCRSNAKLWNDNQRPETPTGAMASLTKPITVKDKPSTHKVSKIFVKTSSAKSHSNAVKQHHENKQNVVNSQSENIISEKSEQLREIKQFSRSQPSICKTPTDGVTSKILEEATRQEINSKQFTTSLESSKCNCIPGGCIKHSEDAGTVLDPSLSKNHFNVTTLGGFTNSDTSEGAFTINKQENAKIKPKNKKVSPKVKVSLPMNENINNVRSKVVLNDDILEQKMQDRVPLNDNFSRNPSKCNSASLEKKYPLVTRKIKSSNKAHETKQINSAKNVPNSCTDSITDYVMKNTDKLTKSSPSNTQRTIKLENSSQVETRSSININNKGRRNSKTGLIKSEQLGEHESTVIRSSSTATNVIPSKKSVTKGTKTLKSTKNTVGMSQMSTNETTKTRETSIIELPSKLEKSSSVNVADEMESNSKVELSEVRNCIKKKSESTILSTFHCSTDRKSSSNPIITKQKSFQIAEIKNIPSETSRMRPAKLEHPSKAGTSNSENGIGEVNTNSSVAFNCMEQNSIVKSPLQSKILVESNTATCELPSENNELFPEVFPVEILSSPEIQTTISEEKGICTAFIISKSNKFSNLGIKERIESQEILKGRSKSEIGEEMTEQEHLKSSTCKSFPKKKSPNQMLGKLVTKRTNTAKKIPKSPSTIGFKISKEKVKNSNVTSSEKVCAIVRTSTEKVESSNKVPKTPVTRSYSYKNLNNELSKSARTNTSDSPLKTSSSFKKVKASSNISAKCSPVSVAKSETTKSSMNMSVGCINNSKHPVKIKPDNSISSAASSKLLSNTSTSAKSSSKKEMFNKKEKKCDKADLDNSKLCNNSVVSNNTKNNPGLKNKLVDTKPAVKGVTTKDEKSLQNGSTVVASPAQIKSTKKCKGNSKQTAPIDSCKEMKDNGESKDNTIKGGSGKKTNSSSKKRSSYKINSATKPGSSVSSRSPNKSTIRASDKHNSKEPNGMPPNNNSSVGSTNTNTKVLYQIMPRPNKKHPAPTKSTSDTLQSTIQKSEKDKTLVPEERDGSRRKTCRICRNGNKPQWIDELPEEELLFQNELNKTSIINTSTSSCKSMNSDVTNTKSSNNGSKKENLRTGKKGGGEDAKTCGMIINPYYCNSAQNPKHFSVNATTVLKLPSSNQPAISAVYSQKVYLESNESLVTTNNKSECISDYLNESPRPGSRAHSYSSKKSWLPFSPGSSLNASATSVTESTPSQSESNLVRRRSSLSINYELQYYEYI